MINKSSLQLMRKLMKTTRNFDQVLTRGLYITWAFFTISQCTSVVLSYDTTVLSVSVYWYKIYCTTISQCIMICQCILRLHYVTFLVCQCITR